MGPQWIWTGRQEPNQHVWFRRSFELPAAPIRALIVITADTFYRLYANGECVLRGPARGFPHALQVDGKLDISTFLRPGRNVLAVHVLSLGVSTGLSVFRDRAGLFLEGSADCGPGKTIAFDTDANWKCTAGAYRQYVARCHPSLGFQEHLDLAAFPVGGDWLLPEFDDSGWDAARVLGEPGILPWRKLEPRSVPLLQTTAVQPREVCACFEAPDLAQADSVAGLQRAADVSELARRETSGRSIQKEELRRCRSLVEQGRGEIAPQPAGRCSGMTLDFGETRYGWPHLEVAGAAGGEICDLLYDLDDSGASLGDRLACRKGDNVFESVQPRGFRYLTLVARNVRQALSIRKLKMLDASYPGAPRGRFACSDKTLNKIWETGVHTLRHCMADTFMDCPERQEQGWAAARIAGMTAFYAFGDRVLYRRALQLMAQSAALMPEGLLLGVAPSERAESALLDYSLHWLISLDEYYQFTGDLDVLKEHRATVERVLSFFSLHEGERGLLGAAPNYALFLDSAPGLDRENLSATFNLLYLQALHASARIGHALEDSGLANHCTRHAAALNDRIFMVFATSGRNLLVESVDVRTGEPGDVVSQHAIALAVLLNVLGKRDEDRTGPVADVLGDFLPPPATEDSSGRVRTSLFFRCFVHQALAKLGLGTVALDDLRRTWGYMLQQGAPTWWEEIALRPGISRCHAWSTHPTAFLSRNVLGLSPLAPGWKRFRVAPESMDLTDAEGVVPTPQGDIELLWSKTPKGGLEIELRVPEGAEAEVGSRVLSAGKHRTTISK
ncbi:MAG TPA: alpha-L-rhamnosidase C-terminal domain-containing protein [Planctomycetota bacterium]|jgi:hypothetical protein